MNTEQRARVVIESVRPEIDGGRFPIKRVQGESVEVTADVFGDGHDSVACALLYRREKETVWHEVEMTPLGNDRWKARFEVTEIGTTLYTITGWVDKFQTWRLDLAKRVAAGQDIQLDLLIGAQLVESAASRATHDDAERLAAWAAAMRADADARHFAPYATLDEELVALTRRYADRSLAGRYARELGVVVDRLKARFSSWYEFFPRSASNDPSRHGTFRDCEELLPDIAAMGFDIVYLPPIHPIGVTNRKGKNNAVSAAEGDVGSPWAIGAAEGGHKAIHPQLGTMEDFERFVAKAAALGIDVALDIAFQCSPDHPYVKEHPAWFKWRPDKTIQYAENPPKKYQDVYPIEFENDDWQALWRELASVFLFWASKGVRIFRVDNPHTKPFHFWEWLIAEVKRQYPESIFLAEAFTRPRVMYRLAKLGFTQSYTYFTWRNTKWEITEYLHELTRSDVSEFFRPNFWPNTPDILPEYLQAGGRPAFITRVVLAATLAANYGIYGPAYELCENTPMAPGKEEYLNSEKYEIKAWNRHAPHSIREIIALLNKARKEHTALQSNHSLLFHETDNELIVCYSKTSDDRSETILVVVNLDFRYKQSGWVTLDLDTLGLDEHKPYQAHDLLSGARYLWQGRRNYVELDPQSLPAHVFRLRRHVMTEKDFDYYL